MNDLDRFCHVDCTFYLIPGGDSNENLRQVCNRVDGNLGCDSEVRNNLKLLWHSELSSLDSILDKYDIPKWMFFRKSQLPLRMLDSSFSTAMIDCPPPSATYSKLAPNFCAASSISEDGSEPALVMMSTVLLALLDLMMRSTDWLDGCMLLTFKKSPTNLATAFVNKSGLIYLITIILVFQAIFSLPSGTK